MDSPLATFISDNAATHSFLIKKLKLARATYYKKIKTPTLFTDAELRVIARNSTLSYRDLKTFAS